MSQYDPIQETFNKVIRDFKVRLDNDKIYEEILKVKSIEDVYNTTDKLQQEQARDGHLRHLSKIEPFLDRLRDYAGVIETLVQAKPNILALIWGPIKLLLQWSYVLKKSFDAIVDTTAEIDDLLPEFTKVSTIFDKNDNIKEVLALFFQDILDFYLVALNFFSKSRWQILFEAMWPRQRGKIELVVYHIERHKLLMRNEVRLEHIQEEHEARVRALAHFEKTENAMLRNEYDSIKTAVSPVFYDAQLYQHRSTICVGTNKWLFKDAKYKQWRAPDDSSMRLIWLQGIPGSGKTVLAASVVDDAQNGIPAVPRTIFAFLSHNQASTTTALSVLHSLIFQLTIDDAGLQTVLCHTSRTNLKNDLKVTASVFSSLLSSAGPVFIVIDGLDEINRLERLNLIKPILELSKSCPETKVMFSSRNEVDIARSIGNDFTIIRTDDQNSGSIQAFVTQRSREWLQTRDFDSNEKAEVEGMLAPIAANAQGMFLYAKIILTYIEPLYDLDVIRDELRVLPKDLHDAYARILNRVNKHRTVAPRSGARRVLGWIGCSPVPLNVCEIEQVLAIRKDEETMKRVRIATNIPELCGPIIEIVDGYVQFVHFTAKEYLFDTSIDGHIGMVDVALDLTGRCIWYLCQDHYEDRLPVEKVNENLIGGIYRLHYYATDNWMKLLILYITLTKPNPLPNDLIDLLQILVDLRSNDDLTELPDMANQGRESRLNVLQEIHPEIYTVLRHVVQFEHQVSFGDTHLLSSESWILPAPLTTIRTAKTIHSQLDDLLCKTSNHRNDCACEKLKYHHGTNLFKCGFLGCASFRQGFSTERARLSHERHHEKSWKCDDSSCEYADIGFLSRRMRDEHLLSHHSGDQLAADLSVSELSKDDMQPMIFDLIRLDKLRDVQALLQYMFQSINEEKVMKARKLLEYAAVYGSATMIKMLYDKFRPYDLLYSLGGITVCAVNSENLETSKLLLSMMFSKNHQVGAGTYMDSRRRRENAKTIAAVITTDSPEFYDTVTTLIEEVFDLKLDLNTPKALIEAFYSDFAIRAARVSGTAERWLLPIWSFIQTQAYRSIHQYNEMTIYALHHIGTCNPSILLAKALLRGRIAAVSTTGKGKGTVALYNAAKKSSEKNARLMEFLLYHGAEPDPKGTRSMPAGPQGRCTKDMVKWLGVSWDKLVARVQADRARGYCPPEYRLDVDD